MNIRIPGKDKIHIVLVDVAIILSLIMAFDPVVRDFVFFRPFAADAVGAFDAVGMVGQLDQFGSPDYSATTANTYVSYDSVPNRRGVNGPNSVVLDETNNRLFVSDTNNYRVLVFNLDGTNELVDYKADFVIGQTDFTTNNSGTDARTMSQPTGIAYDDSGEYLFVSDKFNNRVLVFDASPANLASEAAGLGTATDAVYVLGQDDPDLDLDYFNDSQPDNDQGVANQVGLNGPTGLVHDGTSLFVSDTNNHRVMVYDVTTITSGEPASNELGQTDDDGDLNFFNDNQPNADYGVVHSAGFDSPAGMAFDGTNVYVADAFNHRVMVFDVSALGNGDPAINVLGQNDDNLDLDFFNDAVAGTTQSVMYEPRDVAFSSSGSRLFVSEFGNNRVTVFDVTSISDGEPAVNVIGQDLFTDSFSNTSQDGLWAPEGLAVDAANELLYVADYNNNRVMVFDVDSAVLIPNTPATDGPPAVNLAGQIEDGETVDYSTQSTDNQDHVFTTILTSARGLNGAHGVSHDEDGGSQMFIADTGNNRVLVHTGGLPASGDADIVLGQTDMTASTSATTDTGMRGPQGVLYDGDNSYLFVADTGNNRVLVFDATSLADGMSATYVLGQADMTASVSATTVDGMDGPTAMVVDDTGTLLYVSDTGNNRVLVFDIASLTDGAEAVNELGQTDDNANLDYFDDAVADTTQSGLDGPTGLAIDGVNLYVADTGNNRVMVFDVSGITDGEVAINELGQNDDDADLDFFNDGVADTTQSGLDGPSGLAYMTDASLLAVADTNNNRIMLFDVAEIIDGEDAVQAIGQSDYVTATGDTTQADFMMSGVTGLSFYDAEHVLMVADAGNHRVMQFGLIRITTTSLSAGSVGVLYSGTISESYGQGTVVFSLASGSLPPGLSLSTGGSITGTPTTAGTYPFTVEVTDTVLPDEFSDTQDLSIGIDVPYSATDLLGQLTDDTDLPRWNASGSMGLPNGLAVIFDHTGGALDLVNHRFFYIDGYRVLVYNLDTNNEFVDYVADNVIGVDSVYGAYQSGFTFSAGHFGNLEDIAFDDVNNRLFVVDDDNRRVLVFDTTSITDGEDAIYVIGQTDFTSNSSGTAADKFSTPYDAIYDGAKNYLYVADSSNRRVTVFDASPANLASDGNGTDAFAVLGQPNFSTTTAGTTSSKFSVPSGLEIDSTGNTLYVVDRGNHRALRFDVSTITSGEAATGVLGQTLFTTATTGLSSLKFNNPEGVALDEANGRLFVTDRSNCRVMIFNLSDGLTNGEAAVNWFGGGSTFTTTTCAGSGNITQPNHYAPNKLKDPYDAMFDPGNSLLYITDRNVQREVVYDTSIITDAEAYVGAVGQVSAGDKTVSDVDANGYVSGRGFVSPGGIAIDSAGDQLFVVDAVGGGLTTQRVLRFETDSDDTLADPIADSVLGRKRLRDFSFGSLAISASTSIVTNDSGLAVDNTNNRLFVADSGRNRVLVFNSASISSGMLADNVLGQATFATSTGALTQSGMNEPMGLAYDETGQRLFVVDNNNNRVLIHDVNTATIANGQLASVVLGQPDFTTSSAATTQAKLSNPTHVAYDAERQLLFVTDRTNCRVMVWDVSAPSSGALASYVLGKATFTSATCAGGQAGFSAPTGVAYDADNKALWVLDSGFSRATLFDVATITNGESAIGVVGQTTYSAATAAASQTRFSGGNQLAFDAANNRLYVVTSTQFRVMIYEFLENTTASMSSGTEGEAYSTPLSATGYQGELLFEVASGSLPTGLTISGSTITGTPTVEGTYDFTLRAVDDFGVSTFYDDLELSITIEPGSGGGSNQPPAEIGFFPDRISINDDDANVDGYNVLIDIYAHFSEDFSGTVDVLLSNVEDFGTAIPFRYNIPDQTARKNWPKTVAWDLCFGLAKEDCDLGQKTVYARFYVNLPTAQPALTPIQD